MNFAGEGRSAERLLHEEKKEVNAGGAEDTEDTERLQRQGGRRWIVAHAPSNGVTATFVPIQS
jgi:hypothetical protein